MNYLATRARFAAQGLFSTHELRKAFLTARHPGTGEAPMRARRRRPDRLGPAAGTLRWARERSIVARPTPGSGPIPPAVWAGGKERALAAYAGVRASVERPVGRPPGQWRVRMAVRPAGVPSRSRSHSDAASAAHRFHRSWPGAVVVSRGGGPAHEGDAVVRPACPRVPAQARITGAPPRLRQRA